MVSVNDTHRAEHKLSRRIQQVREASIPDADRDAILAFFEYRRSQGMATNTLTTDLSTLRTASERAEVPLTDMTMTDVQDLLTLLATPTDDGGYGLEPEGSGIFGYARALRIFLRWMHERDDYPDFPFHDEIDLPKMSLERKNPDDDDLLTPDDVTALKQAARNDRDRALIAFLADGPRITLATQLRVGDVHPFGDDPYWTPNTDAVSGHKGVDDSRRTFLWSKTDVATYLRKHHPEPENDDAPLWTTLRDYDPREPQECALSPERVRSMLRECADRAGIEKPVNPHSFRHAAITRMKVEGVESDDIQRLAGWKDLRMLERYDERSDRQKNDGVRERIGVGVAEGDASHRKPEPCWNCGQMLDGDSFCPHCGEKQDLPDRLARAGQRRIDLQGFKPEFAERVLKQTLAMMESTPEENDEFENPDVWAEADE